jgi:hypothetical protein
MQNQPQQPVQPQPPEKDPNVGGEKEVKPLPEEVVKAVEKEPKPIMSEEASKETFSDNATQVQPQTQKKPTQPQDPQTQIKDDDTKESKKIDKTFVKAVDEAIDKYEDKPYEEEEVSEDLETKYLNQRFGKKIEKSKE